MSWSENAHWNKLCQLVPRNLLQASAFIHVSLVSVWMYVPGCMCGYGCTHMDVLGWLRYGCTHMDVTGWLVRNDWNKLCQLVPRLAPSICFHPCILSVGMDVCTRMYVRVWMHPYGCAGMDVPVWMRPYGFCQCNG